VRRNIAGGHGIDRPEDDSDGPVPAGGRPVASDAGDGDEDPSHLGPGVRVTCGFLCPCEMGYLPNGTTCVGKWSRVYTGGEDYV